MDHKGRFVNIFGNFSPKCAAAVAPAGRPAPRRLGSLPVVCFPACGTANQMQIILFKNEVISIDFDDIYISAMLYKLTL